MDSKHSKNKMASNLRKRFKLAQKVEFPSINETCNEYVSELIGAHADAIGCPKEFIYFPFLSTCAGNYLLDYTVQSMV